jgi:hypothetical protein
MLVLVCRGDVNTVDNSVKCPFLLECTLGILIWGILRGMLYNPGVVGATELFLTVAVGNYICFNLIFAALKVVTIGL